MDICGSTDYDHSLLSVIASVCSHFKLPTTHKTLGELDRLLETGYKNVILLIFDGMGMSVLERHLPPDSFLRRNLLRPISSVFPPTTTAATTFDELFYRVKELCGKDKSKYIYGYSPLPDCDMHDFGVGQDIIGEELKKINEGVERLCEEISDSLILVTAYHGMIDTEFVFMDEYPELIEALRCAPSIEGRAMSLFVKPESLENFEKLFNEKYGGIYKLIPHARAVELFGGGSKHRMFDGFIGDFLAVAFGRVSIGYGYDPEPFKAAHGGLTRDELEIPLIAIKNKK